MRTTTTACLRKIRASDSVKRKAYDFKKAKWVEQRSLLEINWRDMLVVDSHEAAVSMVQVIIETMFRCIPSRTITDKAWLLPWFNHSCNVALQRKHTCF